MPDQQPDQQPSRRDPILWEPDGVREPSRYSLAEVLTIIPKTKRSQVELLVRTGRITPAWPSTGTGHDRAFDVRNLFEIAIATELIALGFVGERLTRFFRTIIRVILDDRRADDEGEFLVLLPNDEGALPLPYLVSAARLGAELSVWGTAHVLNVTTILLSLHVALSNFHSTRTDE